VAFSTEAARGSILLGVSQQSTKEIEMSVKQEMDYQKRPEGLAPLILLEWLRQDNKPRSIDYNPIAVARDYVWVAVDSGGRKFHHEHLGGLAAQLRPFTSFADVKKSSVYDGMTDEQKRVAHAIQVRAMMEGGA
jgi:hypothetical protein